MKSAWVGTAAMLVLSSCTSTYPYRITTDGCNCERYIYKDEARGFEVEFTATYQVTDRVESTIKIVFRNYGRDTLSLRQASIKGTSANVRYQFNDRFQPMPYVAIPPGQSYAVTLHGSDTEVVEEPWHKIAGERVTIEIGGVLFGQAVVNPILVTLIPLNPKLPS
jgi:hypothetical protein